MIRALLSLALLFAAAASPSALHAMPILADISNHRVEIHSSFTGTQLLVFGARNDAGDIVILIRGPQKQFVLRKKERVAGIWINREQHTLPDVAQYYRIASNKPLDEVRQYRLTDPLQIIAPAAMQQDAKTPSDMLRYLLTQEQLHSSQMGDIEFMGNTLFKARFDFPDRMPRGIYTAEVFLFNDGVLTGMQTIPVEVYKVGFDAFVYDSAQRSGLLYGIIAVAIALIIGSGTSWLFKRI